MASARRIAGAAAAVFALGAAFALLFTVLQAQHRVTVYRDADLLGAWSSGFATAGGAAAVLVSGLVVYADAVRSPPATPPAATDSLRCIGFFLGMNYAASKVTFDDNVQLSVALAVMALALWYIFDRTAHGFAISVTVGTLGTVATSALASAGAYTFTHADLFGVRSWIPCLLFSAAVCIGTIGRTLAQWAVRAPAAPKSPRRPEKLRRD